MSASLFMFPVRTVLDALWLPSLCGSLSNEFAFSWQESNVLTERHEGRLVFCNCLWWSWGGIFSFLIQPRSHYSMLTSAFQMIIRWACQIAPEKSWISKIPQKQSGAKLWMFFFWPMPRNIVASTLQTEREAHQTSLNPFQARKESTVTQLETAISVSKLPHLCMIVWRCWTFLFKAWLMAHGTSFDLICTFWSQKPSWERRCPALVAGRQTSISNSVGKPSAHGSRWIMAEKMCFVEAFVDVRGARV